MVYVRYPTGCPCGAWMNSRRPRADVVLKRRVRGLSAANGGRFENLFVPEGRLCVWLLFCCRSRRCVGGLIVHIHNKNLVSCVCFNSVPPEMPARRSHPCCRMLRDWVPTGPKSSRKDVGRQTTRDG